MEISVTINLSKIYSDDSIRKIHPKMKNERGKVKDV